MQKCVNCQSEMPDSARFCMECGNALTVGYTPKHLQSSIFEKSQALGERKQVTVLFADIQRSLDLSRAVGAEGWHNILDRFFAILTDAVHSYEGTINQYTGDGVMALFGAPIAFEDHARRGCLTALRIKARVAALSESLEREHGINFSVRIGLNSGEVVVGQIGDDLRRDYTAQGDTVAVAARMEGLARGGTIYAASPTVELVEGLFQWRDKGRHGLNHSNGKPLQVYELRREEPLRRRFDVMREKGMAAMIGRDHEFWQLRRAVDGLGEGQGHLMALRGETGSGKSRLSYEAERYARQQGIPTIELRGRSDYKAAPLQPYADLVRSIFAIRSDDDERLATRRLRFGFRRLCGDSHWQPDYSVLLGLLGYDSTAEQLSGEDFAQEVTDIFAWLIEHGMNRPLLFVIENLHLLDYRKAATRVLMQLVERLPRSKTLLLATYRSDYQPPWPESAAIELDIKPLNQAQLAELLAGMLGADKPQESLALALHGPSGGNPMFAQELLRALKAQRRLKRSGGDYSLEAGVALELPPSVQSAIAARVDALGYSTKRLLQLAAVAGREFEAGLLSRASEMELSAVAQQLAVLVSNDFIYCLNEQPRIVYSFYQAATRDVVYAALLSEQREAAHAAIAAAMTAEGELKAEAAGEAAYHYSEARDWLSAAAHQDVAALWYFERDPDEAARRWEQALGWLRQLPVGDMRIDALSLQILMRLIIHSGAQGFDQTRLPELVAEARELLGDNPSPKDEASLLISNGASELFFGDLLTSQGHYEKAVSRLAESEDPSTVGLRLVATAGLVLADVQLGKLASAIEVANEGLLLADGDTELGAKILGRSPSVNLLVFQAWAYIEQGDFQIAENLLQESLPLAVARAETENRLLAQMLLLRISVERGGAEAALPDMQALLNHAVQCGNTLVLIAAYRVAAAAEIDAGNWKQATEYLTQAGDLIKRHGIGVNQAPSIAVLAAHVELGRGHSRSARAMASDGAELAAKRGVVIAEAECWLLWVAASLSRRSFLQHSAAIEQKLVYCRQLIDQTGAKALLPRWHRVAAELASQNGSVSQQRAELHEASEGWKRLGNLERANEASLELKSLQQR